MIKKALIVEDHSIVSESLKQFLYNSEIGLYCENANTGKQGLHFLNGNHFDLVILDINLPDLNGIEFCEIVKTQNPEQKILAMTSFTQRLIIEQMIKKGVNGLILKTSDLNELTEAIKTVLSGDFYWGKGVKKIISSRNCDNHQNIVLTKRETEILTLISDGYTNQEIAGKLFICCSTVDSHRKNLLLKFRANNSAQLIKLAMLKGIIN